MRWNTAAALAVPRSDDGRRPPVGDAWWLDGGEEAPAPGRRDAAAAEGLVVVPPWLLLPWEVAVPSSEATERLAERLSVGETTRVVAVGCRDDSACVVAVAVFSGNGAASSVFRDAVAAGWCKLDRWDNGGPSPVLGGSRIRGAADHDGSGGGWPARAIFGRPSAFSLLLSATTAAALRAVAAFLLLLLLSPLWRWATSSSFCRSSAARSCFATLRYFSSIAR